MNNNRYNLRSSTGQQQQQPQQPVAPSFFPTSSTTAAMAVNSTTTTTTTTTGIPSSLLSTSNISQTTLQAGQQQPQPFYQQPPSRFGEQHPQQKPQWVSETYAGSGTGTEAMPHHQQYQSQQAQPQNIGIGGPAATAPFLQDFTLVAEAVKRVQMDAVMTEMESITL